MGLLSDTLEDNRERFAKTEMVDFVPLESPPPTLPPEVFCPVCNRVFGSDLALQNHIRSDHASEHVYIRVNDRIVRNVDYFDAPPKSCHVTLLGIDSASLELERGHWTTRIELTSSKDLLSHFPSDPTGEFRIIARYGSVKQDFLIYLQAKPPFDTERLNSLISNLQRQLNRGDEPAWNAFQDDQRGIARNDIERRYLDGFFQYSLGFHLEKSIPSGESGKHLETAMQLLRPFRTSMALTARRILAIRMNCFAALEPCDSGSVFYLSRLFFVDNDLTLPSSAAADALTSDDGSVYIDGFTERLLIAIKAFYARDKLNLLNPIEHLTQHPLAAEKNNEDKILLLKARAHRAIGDDSKARSFYDRLLYHPVFGEEAQAFAIAT